jgi:hypothetical protein
MTIKKKLIKNYHFYINANQYSHNTYQGKKKKKKKKKISCIKYNSSQIITIIIMRNLSLLVLHGLCVQFLSNLRLLQIFQRNSHDQSHYSLHNFWGTSDRSLKFAKQIANRSYYSLYNCTEGNFRSIS